MKNILLKILSILTVAVFLVSMFIFPSSAADYYDELLTPTTFFTRARNSSTGTVASYSDSTANFVLNGVSYFYFSRPNTSGELDCIQFVVNLGNGFTFKKGVNYHINFKLVIPKSYAPNGEVGNIWSKEYFSGFFSWASPQFNSNPDICNLVAPSVDNSNLFLDDAFYDFEVPKKYINYDMVAVDLTTKFIPTKNVTAKAFGIQWDVISPQWYGTVGIGDFYITMPMEDRPVNTPNLDTNTIQNYEEIETEILHGTTEGLHEAGALIQNFSSIFGANSQLQNGLLAVTTIFNHLFAINWIEHLLTISLTFGIFAFVVGMSLFVVRNTRSKSGNNDKGGGKK